MPLLPSTKPAVGKSGPWMSSISSLIVMSGFLLKLSTPSITSVKLWGGIFVAIPTAIPAAPFTSKLGKRAGKTDGSLSLPS